MTNAAVADPAVTSPENETAAPGAQAEEVQSTSTAEGTGATESTSQEPGTTETTTTEEAPNPVVAAEIKRAVTNLAIEQGIEGDFNTFAELTAKRTELVRAAEEEEREQAVRSYYPGLAKTLVDTLMAEGIEIDGEMHYLSEDQVQKIFPHLNDFRGKVRQLEQQENFNQLAQVAEKAVASDQVESLKAALTGKNLPFDQWLREVNEHSATNTKAWKKREADFAVEKEKYGEAKWTEGNNAPAGQPSQRSGTGLGQGYTLEQWQGLSLRERAEAEKKDPLVFMKIR